MAETIFQRIRSASSRAWNAFINRPDPNSADFERGSSSYGGRRPDRGRLYFGGERTILGAVLTKIAVDVASAKVQHIKVDENDRYLSTMNTGLNECLTTSANIDQTGRAFIHDAAISILLEGAIALVPVDTTTDPTDSDAYDVNTLRVGTIKEWYPSQVKVDLYNDRTGNHEELTLKKSLVAIVENPFYNIMNEPNSTLKRLVQKLNLLDREDDRASSGKLDMIIQLPYSVKSETKKEKAKERRDDISDQLQNSEYGIAYTDATEKIIQLNRPVENNLMEQVKYLTSMLYSQLGISETIMDGTADEAAMINYSRRTIEPIIDAIVESMTRTFISKTARTQGQKIVAFTDPFKFVPMSALADIGDKFTRNEILSSNDMRAVIGFKPSNQKSADELRNKNLTNADPALSPAPQVPATTPETTLSVPT